MSRRALAPVVSRPAETASNVVQLMQKKGGPRMQSGVVADNRKPSEKSLSQVSDHRPAPP
ncbi:hypothetical protein [Gimesia maris]|uniref:hypothetical protein n=1 Tax=Gimesia maris TaxID=122 RepID=UPI0032EDA93F